MKVGVDLDNKNVYDYYRAVIRSSTNYYAFGSAMPSRGGFTNTHRYGFNGKKKLEELHSDSGNALMEYACV